MDLGLLYILIQVIFLEGILSIDNAAVLGAMVSVLPEKEIIPWPGPLRFLSKPVHRLLGGQRSAALKVGLLGAYFGRGLMLIMASVIIHHGFLKIIGAGYLIKLAFDNLGQEAVEDGSPDKTSKKKSKGFWSMVIAVELADLAFSLDNVVAVVALSDNLYIIMFGVAIGILTMRFAAGIFTCLIAKEPILKPAAYLIVFNIGLQLLLDKLFGLKISGGLKLLTSTGIIFLCLVYARMKFLHFLKSAFKWLAQGMTLTNELLEWFLIPVKLLFKGGFLVIRLIIRVFIPQ